MANLRKGKLQCDTLNLLVQPSICGVGWEAKTWNGLTSFDPSYIWTDGTNIYYSNGAEQYVLNGNTWEVKTWNGLTGFKGSEIWTDGTNIYCSHYAGIVMTDHYVLNGDTWESKTWNGTPSGFSATALWSDGTNIYYSSSAVLNYVHRVLNGDTWVKQEWEGTPAIWGPDVWSDGTNIYCSYDAFQYVLEDGVWVEKTWDGLTSFRGRYIWTDGTSVYYSNYDSQYVLNGDAWVEKEWSDLTGSYGSNIWSDGTNIYYSNYADHYVLKNSKLSLSVSRMMRYGSMELPEVPDIEGYPYKYVYYHTYPHKQYEVVRSAEPLLAETDVGGYGNCVWLSGDYKFSYLNNNGVWTAPSTSAGHIVVYKGDTRYRWANYDIFFENSTDIYLAASEAVEVGKCITDTTVTVNFSCKDLLYTDYVYRIKAWCYPKGIDYWTAPATWESYTFKGPTYSISVNFTGLLPGTEYEVYAVIYGTDGATEHNALTSFTTVASESETPALLFFANQIATDRFELWLLTQNLPSDAEYTAVVEVFKNDTSTVFRRELTIDGGYNIEGVWVTELEPNTEYTAYVEIYESLSGYLVLQDECTVTTAEETVAGYDSDSFLLGFASGLGCTAATKAGAEYNSWAQGYIVGSALRKAL